MRSYTRLEEAAPSQNQILRQNVKNGIIKRPLPKEIAHLLSSDAFSNLLCAGLGPADVLCTWGPRYSGVLDTILSGKGKVGPFIEATSQNLALAVLFYLAIGAASAYNFYLAYQSEKAAHREKSDSYRKIRQRLNLVENSVERKEEETAEQIEIYNENLKALMKGLNESLKNIVNEQASSKYRKIKLVLDEPDIRHRKLNISDIQITFDFTERKLTEAERKQNQKPTLREDVVKPGLFKRFVNKVLFPIYTSLSLSSFAYWVFWITTSIMVGNFADAGIAGVSAWLGFGVPIAAGAPYAILKMRNWARNKGHVSDEHARLAKIADQDAPVLLIEALKRREYDDEVTRLQTLNTKLEDELKTQKTLINAPSVVEMPRDNSLAANPKVKAAALLYTSVVSNYGLSQFNAWLVSDFLKVSTTIAFAVPFFGAIMGGVLIGLALVLGGYESYKKYKEYKKDKSFHTGEPVNLKQVFNDKAADLARLKTEIQSETKQDNSFKLSKILERSIPKPPTPMSTGRKIYSFFDWKATGIFFARVFFTVGTAIFLPFAAAALTNPITLGILVLSGAVYVGLKIYQAHQRQKEAHAKELVDKIKDMDEQLHVANLTKRSLENTRDLNKTKTVQSAAIEIKPNVTPTLSLVEHKQSTSVPTDVELGSAVSRQSFIGSLSKSASFNTPDNEYKPLLARASVH